MMRMKVLGVSVAVLAASAVIGSAHGKTIRQSQLGDSGASATADEGNTVKVQGRGVGATKSAAFKDAYRDAIERAVGLYVDAETVAKNDELVQDQVLTHSNAYIERYDELGMKKLDGGLIQIRILATVRKRDLTATLKKVLPNKSSRAYTGNFKDIHAQIVTEEKRDADGAALLQSVLQDLDPCTLFAIPSVDKERKKVIKDGEVRRNVSRDGRIPNGQVVLRMLLRLKFDEENYFNSFVPTIKPVLDQIASSSKKVKLSLLSDSGRIDMTAMDDYLNIAPRETERPHCRYRAFAVGYEQLLNQEPCMSPMRVLCGGGYLLRMEQLNSRWGDQMGLEDVAFSSAGNSHGGAGWACRYRQWDNWITRNGSVGIEDVISEITKMEGGGRRGQRSDQNTIQLILVCAVNKAHTVWDAVFYQVDKRTAAAFMIWCNKYGSGNTQSWPDNDRNTAAETVQYNVSYCDKNGDAVLMNQWRIPRICLMNADWGRISYDFGPIRILYISPFFGCFSEEFVQWHDVLIKTDMLQEIESVKIEMEN